MEAQNNKDSKLNLQKSRDFLEIFKSGKQFIEDVLKRCGGNLERAAATIEVPLDVLQKKAKDLGLSGVMQGAGQ